MYRINTEHEAKRSKRFISLLSGTARRGGGKRGFAHLCFQHLARLLGAHTVAAARVSPFPPPSSNCWSSSLKQVPVCACGGMRVSQWLGVCFACKSNCVKSVLPLLLLLLLLLLLAHVKRSCNMLFLITGGDRGHIRRRRVSVFLVVSPLM